ncbi:MAG: tetratricopeptide repeat protein [Spirochaetia bacterium]|nr:tetratricopeptide repeat protein [Spirochaetia bacterium]
MKKIALFVLLSGFLSMNAYDLDQLDSIFQTNRVTELPQIALNLSARGSIQQSKGQYKEAIELYDQSLKLREKLGLNKTMGYATVLFLSSIAHHKTGESCKAVSKIGVAIDVYKGLGKTEEARVAEEEGLNVFKTSCSSSNLVSQN